MKHAQLGLLLLQLVPTAFSQAVDWWNRVREWKRIGQLKDGAEKEAAIQTVLAELRAQTPALDAIIAAKL